MRTASVTEAKNRLSLLLEWVRQGEEVLILERGIPVACLTPVPGFQKEALGLLVRRGLVRPGEGKPHLEDLALPKAKKSALEALLGEREER